jgi:hypothetical protein
LAHIKIPIVFSNHHLQRSFDVFYDLGTEFEFFGLAKLGQVSAVEYKIGLRIQVVNVLHSS